MKHNIFSKALLIAATAGLALSACSPEDFDGVSEAGLPLAENAKVTTSVDDETNTVTFHMEGDGIYPMWYIPVDGKEVTKNPVYSTVNPLQKIWVNSGDYKVYYRVGNRNGMSQGMGETTFHVANTLVDFNEIVGKLSGKEWRIAATEPAHLACGPSGTDGTGDYQAGPNEKAEFGVYDDRLTFGADYSYTYNPGAGGTMYVNKGCSLFPDHHQGTKDYMVPVSEQHSSYKLSVKGDDLYLIMPANTCFPYIPADAAYNGELRLRVESITGSTMVLVWDDGNISMALHPHLRQRGLPGLQLQQRLQHVEELPFHQRVLLCQPRLGTDRQPNRHREERRLHHRIADSYRHAVAGTGQVPHRHDH